MSDDCRQKALDLLARRAHFRRELESKLAARGFEPEAVAEVCAVLERRGLLDDRRAARELTAGPLTRKAYGPLRMRAELERRGAAEEAIDEALAELFPDGDAEPARRAAARWLERRVFDRDRLGRHLGSRGFSVGSIHEALRWAAGRASGADGG